MHNERYFGVVMPHLNQKLFIEKHEKQLIGIIKKYTNIYHSKPTVSDLKLLVTGDSELTENDTDKIISYLDALTDFEHAENTDYLIDETERYAQDRSMELAILESVDILQKKESRGKIQEKIKDALSITFRQNMGFEYFINAQNQFDFYTSPDAYMSCDIDELNIAVGKGFRKKCIYAFIAGTNVGKSIWLCHLSASFLKQGYNVLHLTAEMSENAIIQRIDANLLDIPINDLNSSISRETYFEKIKRTQNTYQSGKLIVKEYPTSTATKNHIVSFLKELRIKKDFVPDIIIADYLNIFKSSVLPASQASDSYNYMRSVTEEFRAIAIEENVALITATQLNREAYNKGTDKLDMTGQGDSWGIPQTLDWQGAIVRPKEIEGKFLIKVLKTRFGSNINAVYSVGIDFDKMRLFNLADEEKDVPIVVKDRLKNEFEKEQKGFIDFNWDE